MQSPWESKSCCVLKKKAERQSTCLSLFGIFWSCLLTSLDYSVFGTLEDYSIDLWKKQIAILLKRNGLISFLTHPYYLIDLKPRGVYDSLLTYLRKICDLHNVWHALPGEVDRWWRARSQMKIVHADDGWKIVGPGSQRMRIAYANLEGDRLVYTVQSAPASRSDVPLSIQVGELNAAPARHHPIENTPQEILNMASKAHNLRARRLPWPEFLIINKKRLSLYGITLCPENGALGLSIGNLRIAIRPGQTHLI